MIGTKFGRNYKLLVQDTVDGSTVTIEPPFTLELDITRKTLGSTNVCQIRIYNLAQKTRDKLYFNGFNRSIFKQVILQAGYGDNLVTIFNGNITQCWSVREGVNFITQIECYDGGFAAVNGQVSLTFPAGTPLRTVIQTFMQGLPNVDVGAIGNFNQVLSKDSSWSGNPIDILYEITGGAFFIDKGKAYALKSNEYIQNIPVVIINSSTGLLNTPVLEQTMARFEMIFEPSLDIGGNVFIDSTTFPASKGVYVITAVKHRGIISEVVSGDLITVGEFVYSQQLIPVIGAL